MINSFCRRNTCCKIIVFILKLVEYMKISQYQVLPFGKSMLKMAVILDCTIFSQKYIYINLFPGELKSNKICLLQQITLFQ